MKLSLTGKSTYLFLDESKFDEENMSEMQLNPFDLQDSYKLENIVPNISVQLRILLIIPATLASA